MATARRNVLTAAQRKLLKYGKLKYSMSRTIDQGYATDLEEGWQSWYATAEVEGQPSLARMAVHRVPLNNGDDAYVTADCDSYMPDRPVASVMDFDALKPEVVALLPDSSAARALGASLLLLEPMRLDEQWRGVGVAELLWTLVLHDLRTPLDAIAAVSPDWAESEPRVIAMHRRTFKHIGFVPFDEDTFVLTDWSLLERSRRQYRERLGLSPSYRSGAHLSLNGMTAGGQSEAEVQELVDFSGYNTEHDYALDDPPLPLGRPVAGAWYTATRVVEETGAEIGDLLAWQRRSARAQELSPSAELRDGQWRMYVYSEAALEAIRKWVGRRR